MRRIAFYNLASQVSREKALPFFKAARDLDCELVSIAHAADSVLLQGDHNFILPLARLHELPEILDRYKLDYLGTVNGRLSPVIGKQVERLSLRGFSESAAIILTDKLKWAAFCKAHNICCPSSVAPSSDVQLNALEFSGPVIVKPSYGTGAINTHVFADMKQLRDEWRTNGFFCEQNKEQLKLAQIYAINQNGSLLGKFMIQPFIEHRRQLGAEVLVENGKVHLAFVGEIVTGDCPQITARAHAGPITPPPSLLPTLQRIVDILGIQCANLTPDFLETDNGDLYCIDMNLNVGGEGLMQLLQGLGIDYARESLRAFLGLPFDLQNNGRFGAIMGSPDLQSCPQPELQFFPRAADLPSRYARKNAAISVR